ncbi:Arm DNA-binding domain-containing protein [Lactiplantibacillus plantarum]|uniref:Arm DNA-binding domain-containing protein n=1 Tax=Lactiplantibacillus plantarum TaxID=1590 RepID=UPI0030798346
MATIKKYQDKDGNTRYQFQVYLGVDPLTGKKKNTRRRGFKTKKKPRLYYQDLNLIFTIMDYRLKTIIQFLRIFTYCGSRNINKRLRKALG